MREHNETSRAILACLLFGLALILMLFMTACMGPQADAVRDVFAQLLAEGKITQAQFDTLSHALTSSDWSSFWSQVAAVGLSIGGAWLGVPLVTNLTRGPISARKGLPPAPPLEVAVRDV